MTPARLVPRTLRARISALSALAVLAVLVAAAVLLVLVQRIALVNRVDEVLALQADVVLAELRAGRTVDEADLLSDDLAVETSGGGSGGDRLGPVVVPSDGRPDEDDAVRVLTRVDADTTVRVWGDLDDVQESIGSLVTGLAVGIPLVAAVLAALVWWAVGWALRPVERIRSRVAAISGTRLDRRLPEPEAPVELARLARTMNAMLARLQASAERQRRFVTDASHELRSPLARMRAELEVDAAHPGGADPAATAASVLAETVALQRLVDDLLLLARGDAGARPPGHLPLDLDVVVGAAVTRARALAGRPDVDARAVRPVQVRGDRNQLERVVTNLLDNACRHARSRVTVTLVDGDGSAVLTVDDDGPGIPPGDRDRVFERFTRLDEARSGSDGGAGLGLAIAREIVERHGGAITVDAAPGGGARVLVTLPGDVPAASV